jgi:DNA-binding response OmpR family regulator
VLNRTGITDITIVDNGKKAVDISAETKFDCIFMDMQMPIMVSCHERPEPVVVIFLQLQSAIISHLLAVCLFGFLLKIGWYGGMQANHQT